jgi:hypothetical protein
MIGEEEERDTVMRTMTGVTGGCYRGDFCGAIAGATMAIGCLFGRANLDEMEDARLASTIRMVYDRLKERAVEKYGDTSCQTISHCNWYDPEDVKARRVDGRRFKGSGWRGGTEDSSRRSLSLFTWMDHILWGS